MLSWAGIRQHPEMVLRDPNREQTDEQKGVKHARKGQGECRADRTYGEAAVDNEQQMDQQAKAEDPELRDLEARNEAITGQAGLGPIRTLLSNPCDD